MNNAPYTDWLEDDRPDQFESTEYLALCSDVEAILKEKQGQWVRMTTIRAITGARHDWVLYACRKVGQENPFSYRFEFRWQTEFLKTPKQEAGHNFNGTLFPGRVSMPRKEVLPTAHLSKAI